VTINMVRLHLHSAVIEWYK